jgi:ribonucleoside-diphosphate reductase alpha chain
MQHVASYNIETTNPCGEQPLPPHGACNLSSINVSAYVIDAFTDSARFDFDQLRHDMPVIVKAMDDVLEESIKRHALPEQREMARKFRNIGIGVMGLADALIKLGMTYGSDEAVKFSKELQAFIFKAALQASVNLGLDRGSFPGYTREVWESDIIKNNIDTKTIEYYKKTNRLRNCSLLSVAPTGLK